MTKIKIFPDYTASGIWNAEGKSMDLDELPISDSLKEEINVMSNLYNQEETYLDLPAKYNYVLLAYRLAVKIKKELPNYEIEFDNDGSLGIESEIIGGRSYL